MAEGIGAAEHGEIIRFIAVRIRCALELADAEPPEIAVPQPSQIRQDPLLFQGASKGGIDILCTRGAFQIRNR